MSKLLKVREVITLKGWVEGSGWSHEECYGDQIIEVTDSELQATEVDWSWWETDIDDPPSEEGDTLIVVDLYAEDADINEDKPLASYSKWASELYKERYPEDDED